MKQAKKISRRQAIQSLATIAAGSLIAPASIFSVEPVKRKVRFAVIGDWGTGDNDSFGIARQMCNTHLRSSLDLVIAAGDNIYPDGNGRHFPKFFEQPFG